MDDALRHFLLIVDHGTYTAAARHAHVSQPALTASIRRLEGQLDARLLDRGRLGATPTAAGKALLPHARAAVVAIDDGRRALQALDRLDAGEVRIGGGQTACTYLLPPVLSAFRRKFPKVALRLREMPEELALDAFEAGELDMVVAGSGRGDRFRDDQIVLVAAPGSDAKSLPFIAFAPGSAVRAVMDRHFPGVPIAMELGSISTVKGSVRACGPRHRARQSHVSRDGPRARTPRRAQRSADPDRATAAARAPRCRALVTGRGATTRAVARPSDGPRCARWRSSVAPPHRSTIPVNV